MYVTTELKTQISHRKQVQVGTQIMAVCRRRAAQLGGSYVLRLKFTITGLNSASSSLQCSNFL